MAEAGINIAQSRGDAVVALLKRAEIAPLPLFYALLYDYLAGEQTLDTARAGRIVDAPGPDGEARLYDEFVRPYDSQDTIGRVVSQLVSRLATLDDLIVERQEASQSQSRTFDAAYAGLAVDEPDARLIREWVLRLSSANQVVHEANARLTAETERAREELVATREELARVARDSLVDPLTGIANRRGLDGSLARAVAEARELGGDLSIAVIDVDHFKRFNDAYGHRVGDEVLKLTARALLANVRSGDFVGRLGGDEFIAAFAGCSGATALHRAEAIRSAILESDMTPILGGDVLGSMTVSIGVASYRDGDSIASLLERADRRLFEAKNQGRNRTTGMADGESDLMAATA